MKKRSKRWSYLLIAVFAGGAGAYMGRGPWLVFHQERAKTRQATDEMKRSEPERAQLLRQKSSDESAPGRERLARERNYMKPGEKPIGQ
jgi:hypothetical protein